MTNYYGCGRTNYFRVTNNAYFELTFNELGIPFEKLTDKQDQTQYCILSNLDSGMSLSNIEPGYSFTFSYMKNDKKITHEMFLNEEHYVEHGCLAFIQKIFPNATLEKEDEKFFESGEFEFEIESLIAEFLQKDSILISMESGAEGMRYINEHACATNYLGLSVTLSLEEIYKMAAKKFDVPLERIAHCSNTNHVLQESPLITIMRENKKIKKAA